MVDTQLDKIKRRLGIEDAQQDDLLKDLIDDAESHFKLLTKKTGSEDVITPAYDFIIRDVVALRYNRKGSEGMKSESVDGYSTTYSDAMDDFKPYRDLLERDFNLIDSDSERQRGTVRFL